MKTYKLIKKYPSLPIDWEEGMKIERRIIRDVILGYAPCSTKYTSHMLLFTEVENFPEYWKEFKEFPIDKKVYNKETQNTYFRKEDGWYILSKTAYTDEDISDNKRSRFEIID